MAILIETAVREFMLEYHHKVENEQVDSIIDENFVKNYSISHQPLQSCITFVVDADLFQYKVQLLIPHEESLWTSTISLQYQLLENPLHQEQEVQLESFSPQEMKFKSIFQTDRSVDEDTLIDNNSAIIKALLSNTLHFFMEHKKNLLIEVMEDQLELPEGDDDLLEETTTSE